MSKATDGRRQLIEAVQKIARSWDASAQMSAMAAVRDRGKEAKEAMETARLDLARHDACLLMAEKVIQEIMRHWPEATP